MYSDAHKADSEVKCGKNLFFLRFRCMFCEEEKIGCGSH